jgi:hypothetical protein
VYGVAHIDLGRGDVLQPLPDAAGVVGDHGVYMTEGCSRGTDERSRCVGVGQVSGDVLNTASLPAQLVHQRFRLSRVGAPRLLDVVPHP